MSQLQFLKDIVLLAKRQNTEYRMYSQADLGLLLNSNPHLKLQHIFHAGFCQTFLFTKNGKKIKNKMHQENLLKLL